ncbi:SDR family NAD(P)-dependent oxidoreductase [Pseudovibrio sp. Ad37]|uniref:SDR family NAD(P)-dependent oxidoreductase n=1 Tax=Pseudovibrio sp. Ad37 TaxID=989422 RepID=UPI0007B19B0D|nr:SDR family NAD(P)-dependent oxidoreductase [Pseudovibrio sp. Ad37]KZL17004.1 3-oxoacyl-[acyl-carrier-protein] reductase FabG [Pseudovibrio sp. Ad37]
MTLDFTPYRAASRMVPRMIKCMYRQQSRTIACPDLPRLDGKTVLVTGGASGVGEFVSRGALARGAKVISMSRGVSESKGALDNVLQIKCDLADLTSVRDAVDQLNGQKIDILFCNAGVVMKDRKTTADGVEMTYAINVLGHHLLYRLLTKLGLFGDSPRIVMTSGDAYVAAKECVPNPGKFSMNTVYGGSKLGNLWQAFELTRRYPEIHAAAVHPGGIMSGLGDMNPKGIALWLLKKVAINEEQGAQASLIAATQDLPTGAYWHNVCGIMELPKGDAGLDSQKAADLWDQLEAFCADYLA